MTTVAQPFWILPQAPPNAFPSIDKALEEPEGLLAAGGDLSPRRLICAYRRGIFPWYGDGQPILWWSPDPRTVLFPGEFRVSRSLSRTLRRAPFELTVDRAFGEVIEACAEPRVDQDGTWITPEMAAAYRRLHVLGHAHSVEAWADGRLAGGLYGVALGRVFFGESMFTRESDASKVALGHLCGLGFSLIDCQLASPHLARLGARSLPRARFAALIERWCAEPGPLDPGG